MFMSSCVLIELCVDELMRVDEFVCMCDRYQ